MVTAFHYIGDFVAGKSLENHWNDVIGMGRVWKVRPSFPSVPSVPNFPSVPSVPMQGPSYLPSSPAPLDYLMLFTRAHYSATHGRLVGISWVFHGHLVSIPWVFCGRLMDIS